MCASRNISVGSSSIVRMGHLAQRHMGIWHFAVTATLVCSHGSNFGCANFGNHGPKLCIEQQGICSMFQRTLSLCWLFGLFNSAESSLWHAQPPSDELRISFLWSFLKFWRISSLLQISKQPNDKAFLFLEFQGPLCCSSRCVTHNGRTILAIFLSVASHVLLRLTRASTFYPTSTAIKSNAQIPWMVLFEEIMSD